MRQLRAIEICIIQVHLDECRACEEAALATPAYAVMTPVPKL